MRKLMRKRILVPVAAIAALALAGIAIAYFTASGTGTGTATVGTDAGVSITDVVIADTLYPGGRSTVRFTVRNLSSTSAVRVGSVVVDSIRTPVGCDAADFSFADVVIDAEIAADGSTDATGALAMENTSVNQDACQGGSVELNLRVDNSGV
ncbi:MAG TPA: hypothetical protein VK506_15430 [Conexibacter sp.]|nr:hypothetical protein [Conexibacter sp.]